MPLLTTKRLLAAKIETTSGTVESVTGSDAAFNIFDLVMQPTAEFLQRKGQGAFGNIKGVVGSRTGVCTFKTEIYGDGSGGVPGWASVFLPACGWVNTAGTFSPKSEPPGSNVKTLTLASYENGMKKVLRGASGTFRISMETGKIAMIEWTFTGAWQAVTDTAMLSPTYPTRMPIRVAAGTLSIGSWAPCFSAMSIDAGNVITPRPCLTAADGSGIHSVIVSDRMVTGTMDPESNLVATSNADVYGDWLAGEEDSFSLVLDDGTDTVTLAGPKMQRTNVQEGDRTGLQIDNVTFQFNRSSGDDEFTIAFGAS